MKKRKLLIFFGLFLLIIKGASSQESTSATGGEASGNGGSVSYTIGQVFYTTITSSDYSISQGVQQPYEISSDSGNGNITLEYLIYPNPTTDFLVLNIANYKQEVLTYILYDTNGKLLGSQKISNSSTKIPMNHLSSATYFLKISDDLKILKAFKIIKN